MIQYNRFVIIINIIDVLYHLAMTKYLVIWQANPNLIPADQVERFKLWLKMLELTKADLQSGKDQDWGMSADLSMGYAITEQNDKEIFADLMRFSPMVQFTIHPVLSVDEIMEIVKKASEQTW